MEVTGRPPVAGGGGRALIGLAGVDCRGLVGDLPGWGPVGEVVETVVMTVNHCRDPGFIGLESHL